MKNESLENWIKGGVKYWWLSLAIGLIAIVLGCWSLFHPTITLTALTILFVVGFLVAGLTEIIFAISNRKHMRGWGWVLSSGVITFLFGVLLIATNINSMVAMLLFVGFWIAFQSLWAIGTSIELHSAHIRGWGWVLAFGIIGLIMALLMIINPAFTAGFLVYMMAFMLILYGVLRIYYSFMLRDIHKTLNR